MLTKKNEDKDLTQYKMLDILYEGKSKKVFKTNSYNNFILHFKDSITAFNKKKSGTINNKGIINCEISSFLFKALNKESIPTHFIKQTNQNEQLVNSTSIIKFEIILRNIAAGSICKRLNLVPGIKLPSIIEICYKDDSLGDPFINNEICYYLNLVSPEELVYIKDLTRKINKILKNIFIKSNLILVDFKLEFGRTPDKKIILIDEITPDSCRLWDKTTNKSLDKDIYRLNDDGETKIQSSYSEVLQRLKNSSS